MYEPIPKKLCVYVYVDILVHVHVYAHIYVGCLCMFTLMCVLRVHIERHTHTHLYKKNIYIYTIVHCKACMRYACTNVCVRTSLARGSRGSLPLFFIQHLCRGTEGLQGSSVHRSSPLQPRKTYLHRPVVGSWRGTHFRSLFTSFRATSFLCV